jgi:hypothetical protein
MPLDIFHPADSCSIRSMRWAKHPEFFYFKPQFRQAFRAVPGAEDGWSE